MHKEYILLNSFRKAKKGYTAGFHVPLIVGPTLGAIGGCRDRWNNSGE